MPRASKSATTPAKTNKAASASKPASPSRPANTLKASNTAKATKVTKTTGSKGPWAVKAAKAAKATKAATATKATKAATATKPAKAAKITTAIKGVSKTKTQPKLTPARSRAQVSTTPSHVKAVPSTEMVEPTLPGPAGEVRFLETQRRALLEERESYTRNAQHLRAEADQLAADREPGDVQFDEESGQGDTMNVERERDLALSAQALVAVSEIDVALARMKSGTYGLCERCGQPIPKERLKALPRASLCVQCKSGGLSRR